MSFPIPSLKDLVTRSRQAFRTFLPGSDAWVWPNNIGPSAKVIAGAVYEVFGFANYIYKQRFAGLADGENLDLHGAEYGLTRRPAGPAKGAAIITAADSITVAVGAIFERTDGVQYAATDSGFLTGAGTLSVPVVSLVDGKTNNAEDGTPLTIISGVTDVNGDAVATAAVDTGGIVGGIDVEPDGPEWTSDLSTFRGRILFRKRNPPHGGNAADYVMWASDVSGVTRVYVERLWSGSGTVRVFVLMDDLYPDGIAPGGEIARVAEYIDTQRPSGAVVTVAAPIPAPVDITITGLTPDTTEIREAVLDELRDMFRRLARVAGTDTVHSGMPYLATPYSFPRAWIWQAVGNAGGVFSDAVANPGADVAVAVGAIPTLGNVTWA